MGSLFWLFWNYVNAQEASFEVEDAIYFFHEGEQVRYQKGGSHADADVPKEINERTWPGLGAYRTRIVAAFNQSPVVVVFILRTGLFMVYDAQHKKILSEPQPISDVHWKGLEAYASDIVAAHQWTDDQVDFFLEDGRFVRYQYSTKSVVKGYPKSPSEGGYYNFPVDVKVLQTFSWIDEKVYFFLDNNQYIRMDARKGVQEGYPREINEQRWPGLGKWLSEPKALVIEPWAGEEILPEQPVVLQLRHHLNASHERKPIAVQNTRFLTAASQLGALSDLPDKASRFVLHTVPVLPKESFKAGAPHHYKKILIQAPNQKYLRHTKEGFTADATKEEAHLFVLDKGWGGEIVLHHYDPNISFNVQHKTNAKRALSSVYFHEHKGHVVAKSTPNINASSLLNLYLVAEPTQ